MDLYDLMDDSKLIDDCSSMITIGVQRKHKTQVKLYVANQHN